MDRIKYFNSSDLMYARNFDRFENMQIPEFSEIDINDAIEFYEIKRYFDKGICHKDWTAEKLLSFQKKANTLYGLCVRYIGSLTNESIVDKFLTIEKYYRKDFWKVFEICKLYNNIDDDIFIKLIQCKNSEVFELLKNKKIVQRYGKILRNYICTKENSIDIVLYAYEQDYTENEKIFLPDELIDQDIVSIISVYLAGEKVDINNLSRVINMRYTKKFPIDDRIRLKAKQRYDEESQKLLGENGISVFFSTNQIDEIKKKRNGKKFEISYSTKWLSEHLDYQTILNNFIYIFQFVDVPQVRFLHVSKKSEFGVLEKNFLISKSKRIYPRGISFESSNILAQSQINKYYNFLKSENIYLEYVLEWCFTEYLQKEFKCDKITLLFPNKEISYAEKCTIIITTIESLIKQFTLYAVDGKINHDLMLISSGSVSFSKIPSLVKRKYIYSNAEKFDKVASLLFSNQCPFLYVERIYDQDKEYSCLMELLLNEEISLYDYDDREQELFDELLKYNLVKVGEDKRVYIGNENKVYILKDLYENEVISKWNYDSKYYGDMQKLLDENLIREESSLFSNLEVNYLNYLLNSSEFVDGFDLRNKYAHGIQQVITDENVHYNNYLIFLRILVLFAIKINDDFCIKERLENKK